VALSRSSFRGECAIPAARSARRWLPFWCALASGCGHQAPSHPRDLRALLLASDDNRPSAALTFPSLTYEALVRFNPPAGKHRPWRLWLQAQAPGTVTVSLYNNTVFDAPGEPIDSFTRQLEARDVSEGGDGRWVVEDLQDLDAIEGPIWVGVRKVVGAPALWTSAGGSGQSYLRDRDPTKGLGILPVKRTPMVRLELAPAELPRGAARCAPP
jgi:hypothetical protein